MVSQNVGPLFRQSVRGDRVGKVVRNLDDEPGKPFLRVIRDALPEMTFDRGRWDESDRDRVVHGESLPEFPHPPAEFLDVRHGSPII